jgi:hypothetical protein
MIPSSFLRIFFVTIATPPSLLGRPVRVMGSTVTIVPFLIGARIMVEIICIQQRTPW